ncbi:hypothetical protein F4815DRAFT_454843 [Daldinia loculata]|nr:hypothetical protein F4815DRAFT_454843 [Daldinia loculata]
MVMKITSLTLITISLLRLKASTFSINSKLPNNNSCIVRLKHKVGSNDTGTPYHAAGLDNGVKKVGEYPSNMSTSGVVVVKSADIDMLFLSLASDLRHNYVSYHLLRCIYKVRDIYVQSR